MLQGLLVPSSEVLKQLAEDEDWRVRAGVARYKYTPPEVLIELADRSNEVDGVRIAIAGNPNTPPEAFAILAGDLFFSKDMRKTFFANPSTPSEVINWFVDDLRKGHNEDVRMDILKDPNTPKAIREKIRSLRQKNG